MPPRLLPLPSATLRQWHLPACSPSWTSPLPILAKNNTFKYARSTFRCNSSALSPKEKHDPQAQSSIEFHRTASRHVLRAILRECTYFPDRFAAEWIRGHALSSYRTYETRIWKNHNDPAFMKRLEIVRRKSRQAMYQLQRANEGDRRMLVKAISMAYGRIGKRRRQLMAPLLPVEQREQYLKGSEGSEEGLLDQPHTETPATGADAQKRTGLHQKPSKGRPSDTVKDQVKEAVDNLPRPLCALVQSQTAASPPTVARRNLRRLGTEIPELNSWHKPMPQVRIKNKLKQWYANVLSTVQPPLPDAEWRSLRDLALRKKEVKLPIRRRKQLATPPSMLEMVVMRGKLPADLFRKDHAHKITPRYMQRIWATVFSQCPLMEYDSQAEKWTFTWGNHVLNDRRTGDSVDTETATDQTPLTQKILLKDDPAIQDPQ